MEQQGRGQNIVAAWPAILSNELSLCRHCHPADGGFDPRDPLVHTISLNILTEVNKEVKKSAITSSKRD